MTTSTMLGMALGSLIVVLIGYALVVYFLAQRKMFFTSPKEATAEFVMAGNTMSRMIAVWKGHSADADDNITNTEPALNALHYANPLNWMEPWGFYWIGIAPFYKIYRYDFVWMEEGFDAEGRIIPRMRRATKQQGDEGQTSYIRLNDTNYFIVVYDVKTSNNLPIMFVLLVTVRITNPRLALFGGEDWLERTGGVVSDTTGKYSGVLTYEDIVARKPVPVPASVSVSAGTQSLEDLIKANNLETDYGVKIVATKIHALDFADSDAAKQFRAATTQKYVAEQEGLGKAAKALGEATAIRTLAEAEQYRIDTTYGAITGDDKRMEIRRLEAFEKSGSAGGNTVVVPSETLGLVAGLAKKLGGTP